MKFLIGILSGIALAGAGIALASSNPFETATATARSAGRVRAQPARGADAPTQPARKQLRLFVGELSRKDTGALRVQGHDAPERCDGRPRRALLVARAQRHQPRRRARAAAARGRQRARQRRPAPAQRLAPQRRRPAAPHLRRQARRRARHHRARPGRQPGHPERRLKTLGPARGTESHGALAPGWHTRKTTGGAAHTAAPPSSRSHHLQAAAALTPARARAVGAPRPRGRAASGRAARERCLRRQGCQLPCRSSGELHRKPTSPRLG